EDGIRDFHVTGVQTCALPIFYDTERVPQWEFDAGPRLVVISQALTPPQQQAVERYLNQGGHAVVVLKNDEMVAEMSEWLGGISQIGRASCREGGKASGAGG